MVLMPCRAADTGAGTELSDVLTAVSLSTPVIRKSTVGRMVMLPIEEKSNYDTSLHCESHIAMLMKFVLSFNLTHITIIYVMCLEPHRQESRERAALPGCKLC